LVAGA
jgi:hypothetical protein